MKFAAFVISLLVLLVVFIEARDKDIDEEAYKLEKRGYCPRYERWHSCGNGCEPSCTHPDQPRKRDCKRPCIPYSCRCKKGLFRDNQGTGRCVSFENCKKW